LEHFWTKTGQKPKQETIVKYEFAATGN
jgi:ubiquitin C-terminal hydrolase